MADETTTEEAVQTGADTAQPAEPAAPAAAPEATPASEQQPTAADNEERAPSPNDEDAELHSWAQNKGLTLDSENATKAAKMAREAERAMHEKAGRASELEKSMSEVSDVAAEHTAVATNQDPELLKRLQRMEVKTSVQDFWNTPLANGETPDRGMEQAMIKELEAKPYLAGDLETLYASASFKQGTASAKSEGAQQALQNLAHKQQATVPQGHATNPAATPSKQNFADKSIEEMEADLGFVQR